VQPLILRVPGVRYFQSQVPQRFCSYFSLYYALLQVQVTLKLFDFGCVSPLVQWLGLAFNQKF
jgi:hypothetical protein